MRNKKKIRALFVFLLLLSSTMYLLLVRNNEILHKTGKVTNHHNISKCEIIHIGLVCAGYKYNIYLHTMLKSLYFYRNNPIHFHIMADDASKNVLSIMFQTWDVPEVNVTFYNANDFLSHVRWVPKTQHYSGQFGLLKLIFPKAIVSSVTSKLIVIDSDLMFNADIYELWNLFNDFNEHQGIGLVEHQNDYYLGKLYVKSPWPAIGRGFNSGVMLLHLKNLGSVNWYHLWTSVTQETVKSKKIKLPDQDIINAVLKNMPSLLYKVPCEWNIQLNDFTESHLCYNINKIKIVHWNSPRKLKVDIKDIEYFRALYKIFLELDGNILRHFLYSCSDITKHETDKKSDDNVCFKYQQDISIKRRTLLFVKDFKHTPGANDVTFVSQLNRDKLPLLEELSRRWTGPISLTLYVTDSELHECLDFIENSKLLRRRRNIAYHVVFKDGNYYPINELRNRALRNVVTPYVFLVDLDLIPMKGLYLALKKSIGSMKNMDKMALVVPAFESQKTIPQSKKKLLQLLDKSVFPFHYRDAPQGHKQTNYSQWKTATEPYQVHWAPFFEPYVVVKSDVVKYDNTFVGFGWNKVSHIMELFAQEYKFMVLTNAFIVHKNHPDSLDLHQFKYSSIFRKCVTNAMKTFVDRISKTYGIAFDKNAIT